MAKISDQSNIRKYVIVFFSVQFCMTLSFRLWRSVFENFAVEVCNIDSVHRGMLESIREIPGAAIVVLSAVTIFFTESTLASLCLFITSLGMFMFNFSGGFGSLILPLLISSIGMHLFMPLRSSLALSLTSEGKKAKQLSLLSTIGAIAGLIGSGIVYLIFTYVETESLYFAGKLITAIRFRGVFVLATIVAAIGGIMMLTVSREEKVKLKQKKFIFRRKYSLYYIITFLAGCRRHIFVTFAVYALVKVHGVKADQIAILMAVNNVLNICTRYLFGHFVDRVGEKRALMLGSTILVFVFMGYAYVTYLPLLYILYCLDNICFGFEVARTTYLDKIAPKEHIVQSISLGVTVNHLSAIPVPIIGGLIWEKFGYSWTFIAGVGILVLLLIAASRIRTPEKNRIPKKD